MAAPGRVRGRVRHGLPLIRQPAVRRVTGNHHIPISNTSTAVLALETV
ncbi:hypothetical protein [Polaromonas sp.]|jgi:hypothetical protein|nr:hypothetical protein [Polaromonas sp.]MBT9477739.1 hypothetical protein [Polaromonas sp.]